jgi:hypothetical protein
LVSVGKVSVNGVIIPRKPFIQYKKGNKHQQTLAAILLALLVGVFVIYGEGSPLILGFLSADVLNFAFLLN